jgi:hypothetical protein
MSEDNLEMHFLFFDWMRPSGIGTDRESLNRRWITVNSLVTEGLDTDQSDSLCQYVFGVLTDYSKLAWFQEAFKSEDATFSMVEEANRVELTCLASVVLLLTLEVKDENAADLGNLILCIEANGFRKRETFPDLSSLAVEAIQNFVGKGRERPKVGRIPSVFTTVNVRKITENLDGATIESTNDVVKNLAALTVKSIKEITTSCNHSLSSLEKYIEIQDEEINILWWIINSYSELLAKSIDDLSDIEKSTVVGIELALLSVNDVEPPSLESLLLRMGLKSETNLKLESLADIPEDILKSIVGDDLYVNPETTPYHLAIKYILFFGKATWLEHFTQKTSISAEEEVNALQWAVQFCRERLLIRLRQ